MIRVAILADTHGCLDARVEVLVADCDLAVHGGDIGNDGVLERLRPRQGKVIAVFGNNDCHRKWPPEQRHDLENLREHEDRALSGGTLAIIHGHQIAARYRHERLRRRFPRARAIVYGHSHRLIAIVSPGCSTPVPRARHEPSAGRPAWCSTPPSIAGSSASSVSSP